MPGMSDQPEIVESSLPFAREHIERYVATNGEDGHLWNGVPTLLITTTGAKTGRRIRQALIYGRSEAGGYVVVASKGGAPTHPGWFFNLQANPKVTVQVGAEVFEAVPRVAEGAERAALWTQMNGIWPPYDEYQTKTDRVIPVVVLDRA
jgi:deazaflavin-dependent oxidoreductase (nitroreductase family)